MRFRSPGEINIAFEEDNIGGDAGQGIDVGSDDIGDAIDTGSDEGQSAYFDFDYGEDGKGSYATREDLAKGFRENYFRTADYTRKTMSLADERKKFEAERDTFSNDRKAWEAQKGEYDGIKQLIDAMPEGEFQRLLREVQTQSVSPEVREMQKRLDAMEREKAEREEAAKKEESRKALDRDRNKAYEVLQKQYPDFNRETVEGKINEMLDQPEALQYQLLMELVYKSLTGASPKGGGPKKRSVLQGSVASGTAKSGKTFANLDEALDAALDEI